jgi:phosphopantothenoylcysteine decarboxylase/phosphopantothenate--cysteine ligase
MQTAVMAHQDCDLFFSVAAVADWRVNVPAEQKIKKATDSDSPALNLIQNPDILFEYAQQQTDKGTFCVGFAAETENILEYGKKKLLSKNIPLLIANHGPNTFGEDINQVTLIDALRSVELGPADKLSLARDIIHAVAQRLTP